MNTTVYAIPSRHWYQLMPRRPVYTPDQLMISVHDPQNYEYKAIVMSLLVVAGAAGTLRCRQNGQLCSASRRQSTLESLNWSVVDQWPCLYFPLYLQVPASCCGTGMWSNSYHRRRSPTLRCSSLWRTWRSLSPACRTHLSVLTPDDDQDSSSRCLAELSATKWDGSGHLSMKEALRTLVSPSGWSSPYPVRWTSSRQQYRQTSTSETLDPWWYMPRCQGGYRTWPYVVD